MMQGCLSLPQRVPDGWVGTRVQQGVEPIPVVLAPSVLLPYPPTNLQHVSPQLLPVRQCHCRYVSVRYEISVLQYFIGHGRPGLSAMEPREDGLALVCVPIIRNTWVDEALLCDWTYQLTARGD